MILLRNCSPTLTSVARSLYDINCSVLFTAALTSPLICSFVKPFDESNKDAHVCEEEGFAEAVDDAIAAIELPIGDRGSLVAVILSEDEEDIDAIMECEDRENLTPESTREGGKRGKEKSKRKRRAYIADDSEDEDQRQVSSTKAWVSHTRLLRNRSHSSALWLRNGLAYKITIAFELFTYVSDSVFPVEIGTKMHYNRHLPPFLQQPTFQVYEASVAHSNQV